MAFDWTSLIGPAVGALAGGGSDTQTTTNKSDPWGPAQPYMLRNLQDTEQLGNYYKKNPFNQQQTESYSNLFADNNNFRNNIAPGLMQFANNGMGSNYQRARVNRPGDVAGYGGGTSARRGSPMPSGVSGGLLGPFSVGGGSAAPSGGLLDLNGAQNPFANGGVTANPQTVTEEMIDTLKQEIGLGNSPGNDAGDSNGPGGQYAGAWGGGLPNLDSKIAAMLGIPGLAYSALQSLGWGTPTAAQINARSNSRLARQAGVGEGGGGYGTDPNAVGAPTAAQAQAIAASFARDFGGYSGDGSAGASFGGAGGFGAGDYGDGTDR
jgi:hypothetical protein